jgi:hypothetical protein
MFHRLDGGQAAAHEGELQAAHREVYGEADQGAVFAGRLRVWRRQQGFVLTEARHGGYLVGFAAGMPLRSSTSWWKGLTTALPADVTAEYPGRTFALMDLVVLASWRRQGVAGSLHDLILGGRPEERATVAVSPGATAAQRAFRTWGWTRIGRTRGSDPGSPVLDVLVLALPPSHD